MNEQSKPSFSKRHPRAFLLLIFAACAAPIVASFLTYYVWKPAKLMNHGELMEIKPLPAASFTDLHGKAVQLQANGKWTLLALEPGSCDAACREQLHIVQQVMVSYELNKDRLQGVWAISDDAPPNQEALAGQTELQVLRATPELVAFLPQPSAGHIYLIDNQGNQVLRYLPKPEFKRMIKDISRLLLIKKM